LEQLHVFHVAAKKVHRHTILADLVVDLAQTEIQINLEGEIPECHRNGESALAGCNGSILVTGHEEIGGEVCRNPPKPQLIVQGFSQPFSLTQVLENPLVFP
jgi:hypothetical protein